MEIYLTFATLFLGFTISNLSIPAIIKVANKKKIFEPIEERRLHTSKVSPLGGIAVFIGFLLASVIAAKNMLIPHLEDIITSLIVLFLVGIKDDLIPVRAYKKLLVQLFAALLLVLFAELRLSNAYGLLGIHSFGHWTSISFTLLFILTVVNAFNLIDGVDGLASGLAMLAATIMGIWFYMNGIYSFSIMAFALVGALSGFFVYNVFSVKNKIFLGDTGSLITGAVIAILLVKFMNWGLYETSASAFLASPSVAFALVCIPLIDTMRVITIRIWLRRSPFSADKNHVHHRLLELVPNHLKVTGILVGTNLAFILAAGFMSYTAVDINIQFFALLTASVILSFVPSWLIRGRSSKPKLQTSKN